MQNLEFLKSDHHSPSDRDVKEAYGNCKHATLLVDSGPIPGGGKLRSDGKFQNFAGLLIPRGLSFKVQKLALTVLSI